ncbi:MAG: hypothetical protein P8N43_04700 [Alphaproteobacteria bacterium]|jgi:opacity protein-like surface antigen|nr:hypothetical protein [Alphaproteobacteria bacterium]
MRRVPGSIALGAMACFLVIAASSSVPAQDTTSSEATWYFIGDTDSPLARLNQHGDGGGAQGGREPYLSLDAADAAAPSYEFVLTLSDDSDPERLRFTTGQSLDISGRSEKYTFLVNRSFDWQNASPITPHFMAGLGMTYTDDQGVAALASRSREGASTWQPALQFGFGASYDLSSSWALVAQYRALILGADTFVLDGEADSQFTQNFMIGARIRF